MTLAAQVALTMPVLTRTRVPEYKLAMEAEGRHGMTAALHKNSREV
jgi:hypothetical protein